MFLKFSILVFSFVISANSQNHFPDYYWRAYNGSIPSDAYEGGENADGKIFIGQVLLDNLTPAEILPGVPEVIVPESPPVAKTNMIKILCSNNHNLFRWYATTSKDLKTLLTQKTVMRGGISRTEEPYYIGRVYSAGQLIIGRILVHRNNANQPIIEFAYKSGGGYSHDTKNTYEVLLYEDEFNNTNRKI